MTTAEFKDREVSKYLDSILKKTNKSKKAEKSYATLVSAIVYGDIIDHFDKEQGPDKKWPPLQPKYAAWKKKRGYTKKLVISGRLRNGLVPIKQGKYRKVSNGLLWANPVSYSGKHDRGEGVPQRKFMWLSEKGLDKISEQTLQFILDERFK